MRVGFSLGVGVNLGVRFELKVDFDLRVGCDLGVGFDLGVGLGLNLVLVRFSTWQSLRSLIGPRLKSHFGLIWALT